MPRHGRGSKRARESLRKTNKEARGGGHSAKPRISGDQFNAMVDELVAQGVDRAEATNRIGIEYDLEF